MSATRITSPRPSRTSTPATPRIRPGARPSRRVGQHRRQHGDQVRFLTGTDDNSLKNVLAAQAEHLPTPGTRRPQRLRVSTHYANRSTCPSTTSSAPPRPPPPARSATVWHACEAAGDLYRKHYQGLYCVGCEQFLHPSRTARRPLPRPRHPTPARHRAELVLPPVPIPEPTPPTDRQRPATHRTSRTPQRGSRLHPRRARRHQHLPLTHTRAHGWGIPYPTTPTRSSTSGGTPWATTSPPSTTPTTAPTTNTGGPTAHGGHTCSARENCASTPVYWPAMLLSAAEPLPTDLLVHDYLTADARRSANPPAPQSTRSRSPTSSAPIPCAGGCSARYLRVATPTSPSKSSSTGPTETSPMTWATSSTAWSHDPPYLATGDRQPARRRPMPTLRRLIDRPTPGNLPDYVGSGRFRLPPRRHRSGLDHRGGGQPVHRTHPAPRHLAMAERDGDPRATAALDSALDLLVQSCRAVAEHLRPFLPRTAARITAQCTPSAGGCPPHNHSFPRSPYQPSKPGHLRLGRRSGPPHTQRRPISENGVLRVLFSARAPRSPCSPTWTLRRSLNGVRQ